MKETPTGKLVTEWQGMLDKAETKPEVVDMSVAISGFMGVKDAEETVSICSLK